MDITPHALRLSYDEAKMLAYFLEFHKIEEPDNENIDLIRDYLIDKTAAIKEIARADIKLINRHEPLEEEVQDYLRDLGNKFMSIVRREDTDNTVKNAVSGILKNFEGVTHGSDSQENIISTASSMNADLFVMDFQRSLDI